MAEIEIETSGGSLRPGGTIDIRVTIRPKTAVKIHSGQLELTCTERSWHKDSATEKGPGRIETQNVLSQPLIQSFIADTELTGSDPVVRYARLRIPKEAPPTVRGSITEVSWEVTCFLSFESGSQLTTSKEVSVLTLPVISPGRSAADLTEEATFTGCTLAMVLVNDVVGSGNYLEGELRTCMNSTDHAKDIRMELLSTEISGDREDESILEQISLESNVQLTADHPYIWPFSLPVPKRILPTVSNGRTNVSWRLRAVVETKQQNEDYSLERAVQVFTSTGQA
jgi:hypothetical protein